MMRARLTTEPDGRICLESGYDRAFVDGLKAAIAWDGRSWDGQRRRWLVSALYATDLLDYLARVGASVQDDRETAHAVSPLSAMPEDLRRAFDTLHLAPSAPLCVADAAFKALSFHCHPDRGGDGEMFVSINNAISTIRQYLDPKDRTDVPF